MPCTWDRTRWWAIESTSAATPGSEKAPLLATGSACTATPPSPRAAASQPRRRVIPALHHGPFRTGTFNAEPPPEVAAFPTLDAHERPDALILPGCASRRPG